MKTDKNYVEFVQNIEKQIVQSQHAAARLANKGNCFFILKQAK